MEGGINLAVFRFLLIVCWDQIKVHCMQAKWQIKMKIKYLMPRSYLKGLGKLPGSDPQHYMVNGESQMPPQAKRGK